MHYRSTERAKTLHNVSDSDGGPIQTFGGLVPRLPKNLKPNGNLTAKAQCRGFSPYR
jgi:hypothetical protein